MITKILPNSNPYPSRSGINQRVHSSSAVPFKVNTTNDICYCAIDCDYVETVFAESGGESYKNDFSSFLFRKSVPTDTISFELWKDGSKASDLIDNTYGAFYSSFASQPLQTGFVVSWKKVFSLLGPGLYQVRTNTTILGSFNIIESRLFRLYPYNDELADKTVKIIGYQNANIKQSPFNFQDLIEGGWAFYIRVSGDFEKVAPEEVEDRYLDSEDNRLQRQDQLISQYQLIVKQAPASIINLFLDGSISLAERILVTDYNIMNMEIFRDVELYRRTMEYVPIFGQRLQDIVVNLSERNEGKYTQHF